MLPTCLVGSYPQPEWLIDRARLSMQVPRVRARDLWLVAPENLEAAQDDATLLAIRDQERARAFDAQFIRLARAVYVENDERAAIKRRINTTLGSRIIEEKSYREY